MSEAIYPPYTALTGIFLGKTELFFIVGQPNILPVSQEGTLHR
jgi:hypothetical protein